MGEDVVEFFDLHQMDPRHMFLPCRSRTRTGTYSVCVLGVGLRYPRHDELMMWAQMEDELSRPSSILVLVFPNSNSSTQRTLSQDLFAVIFVHSGPYTIQRV